MVLSVLPGRPLVDLERELPPAKLREVLVAAGGLLATLNSVRAPGAWKPEADGSWNTWDDIKPGFLAERRSDRDALVTAGLSEEEAEHVLDLVAGCIDDYPWTDPVLCHGDFVPDHIFVDEDLQIRGLIDFGMFHGGPPVSDLAYLRFSRPDLDQAAVLSGYGVSGNDAEFLLWRDLYAVTQAVGYLAHSVQVGDTAQAGRHVDAIRGLVRDVERRTR
jgi:aminoglycoside phosphotransferase (APT) family kinase protein